MSRTITALFDTRSDAEAARSRLTASNIDADNVRIVDQSDSDIAKMNTGSTSSSSMSSTDRSSAGTGSYDSTATRSGSTTSASASHEGGGFLASVKNLFLPDEDRHSYEEGVRRGGSLLYASVDEDDVDRAIMILEESSSVDMDERESSWKNEGWAGYTPMAATASTGSTYASTDKDYASTNTDRTVGDEQRIQLAEEKLTVGKREVNRGGARIRSYVVETPVTEEVTLREEHVNVERRPVTGSTTGTADTGALFQDRTIEMTETAEEAVVSKTARVTEELVVSKTSDEHTETISDTVRRTEVDIDEDVNIDRTSGNDRSAIGGTKDRDRM